jgi:hypothetical protein
MFVKKPDISEWARDCKTIGEQIRRYGYASNQMPDDVVKDEWNKTVKAIQGFANKYGMDYGTAEQIGGIVADSVALGLAF